MSTYARVAELPLRDRLVRARAAPARRLQRVHPSDDGHSNAGGRARGCRRGRHLRSARPRRTPGGRTRPAARRLTHLRQLLASCWAASTCSRRRRSAMFRVSTGGGASRAPRSTSRSGRRARPLRRALGREARPVTFVVSLRLGSPPSIEPLQRRLGALSEPSLQARPDQRVGRCADRPDRRDRRRRFARLQGVLQGNGRRLRA